MILGRGSGTYRAAGVAALLVPVVIVLVGSFDPRGTSLIPNLVGFGLVASVFVLGLSLRIEGTPGYLVLTGPVAVWTVPVGAVLRLSHDNGLQIHTTTGTTIGHWGYGGH